MDDLVADLLKTSAGALLGTWVGYRIWLRQRALDLRHSHDRSLRRARLFAYRRLWKCFRPLAIHGVTADVGQDALTSLSRRLSDWYFDDGILLTSRGRDVFLLLQAALDRAIGYVPADVPYVVRKRGQLTGVKEIGLPSLQGRLLRHDVLFDRWLHGARDKVKAWSFGDGEADFALLQRLSSSVRTLLARDLASRAFSLIESEGPAQ